MRKNRRPPGGHEFEAVQIVPDGWCCLTPWIQTPDGYWWRAHIEVCCGYGEKTEHWAKHMAQQINAAMRKEKL